MAKDEFVEYVRKKKLNMKDELWKQGDFLVLYDENEKPISIEGYGSYKNSKRLKDDKKVQMGLYTTDDLKDIVDGVRMKMFFRVPSEVFPDLIDEKLNNENCSYVTSVDSLLSEHYVPTRFSAVISQQYGDAFKGVAEEIACKLLNFYGSPTVFYKTIYEKASKGLDHKINPLTVSVDFLKTGEDFISLGDYYYYYTKKNLADIDLHNVKSILDACNYVFKNHQSMVENKPLKQNLIAKRKGLTHSEKDKIAYAMLLRRYCLGDSDFHSGNIGLIINEQAQEIKMAPAFDFEFCFEEIISNDFKKVVLQAYRDGENIHDVIVQEKYKHGLSLRSMLADLEFLKSKHPKVLEKFIGKTEELLALENDGNSKLDNMIDPSFSKTKILKSNEKFYWDNELALPIDGEEQSRVKGEIKDNFLFMKLMCEDVMQNENFEYLENFEAIK